MAGQIVRCNSCGIIAPSKMQGNIIITVILFCCYIVPGLIYMLWRRQGIGVCSSCGSDSVVPNHTPNFAHHRIAPLSIDQLQEARVRCPECCELILEGAKKCKHCGSQINVS